MNCPHDRKRKPFWKRKTGRIFFLEFPGGVKKYATYKIVNELQIRNYLPSSLRLKKKTVLEKENGKIVLLMQLCPPP
jgi:hypothetical protein